MSISLFRQMIIGLFENVVGKGNTKKQALLLSLISEGEKGDFFVELLLYAPGNYVGVYTREAKLGRKIVFGKWKCLSYHDSCWRTDGVGNFFSSLREDQYVSLPPICIQDNGVQKLSEGLDVIELSERDIEELNQARDLKS